MVRRIQMIERSHSVDPRQRIDKRATIFRDSPRRDEVRHKVVPTFAAQVVVAHAVTTGAGVQDPIVSGVDRDVIDDRVVAPVKEHQVALNKIGDVRTDRSACVRHLARCARECNVVFAKHILHEA